MDSPQIPNENYVGLLQSKCAKNKVELPRYEDVDLNLTNHFKIICHVEGWSSEGTGFSKKAAKQSSAKAMYEKIKSENLFEKYETKPSLNDSAVSKINTYCSREKKDQPLYSECPKEDGFFVVSCKFDDFTAVGKGSAKKIAKEEAANAVAKHFEIHKYHDNLLKSKERKESLKNPTQELQEYCQPRNLTCSFTEEILRTISKQVVFVVTCTVGDVTVKSSQLPSKKQAKMDASSQMLNVLKSNTPTLSPYTVNDTKTKLSEDEYSSEEEPLAKRTRNGVD